MKRCHQCEGKFGLVRYHYVRYSFCSQRCLTIFKNRLAAEISLRKLYGKIRGTSAEQRSSVPDPTTVDH